MDLSDFFGLTKAKRKTQQGDERQLDLFGGSNGLNWHIKTTPDEPPGELGETRIIDGTTYVFSELTPGKPRWHTQEEIDAAIKEGKYVAGASPKPTETPATPPKAETKTPVDEKIKELSNELANQPEPKPANIHEQIAAENGEVKKPEPTERPKEEKTKEGPPKEEKPEEESELDNKDESAKLETKEKPEEGNGKHEPRPDQGDGANVLEEHEPEGLQENGGREEVGGVRASDGSGHGGGASDNSEANGGKGEGEQEATLRPGEHDSLGDSGGRLSADEEKPVTGVEGFSPVNEEINRNYIWTDEDLERLAAPFNLRRKFEDNVAAISLLKKIEGEGRMATSEEQAVLARYVGWGGMPQVFDEKNVEHAKEFQELEELLTPEEYDAAKASTPNAHYTSPTVVKFMLEVLRQMGFIGGKILDPAIGIGNFFFGGLRDLLGASKITGIELDSITSRIAHQLLPNADIRNMGFESAPLKDGYFDLVLTNVPFGNYTIRELVDLNSPYAKEAFSIHNFFLAKAAAKLRKGGIIATVISRHFMDAMERPNIRDYLHHAGLDLVAAVRLPDNAFSRNANTRVVTDIVFLKKRDMMDELGNNEWLATGIKSFPYTRRGRYTYSQNVPVHLNEYYLQHPDNILGMETVSSSQYGGEPEYDVEPGDLNLGEEMVNAFGLMPSDIYTPIESPEAQQESAIRETRRLEGSLHIQDGKAFQVQDGEMVPYGIDPKNIGRLRMLTDIRDKLNELVAAESSDPDDTVPNALRQELNLLYDRFRNKYGILSGKANSFFYDDPHAGRVMSLEKTDVDEHGRITKVSGLATIMQRRTTFPYKAEFKGGDVDSALAYSLNTAGRLDIPLLAQLSKKPEQEIIDQLKAKGLIIKNPATSDFETTDEYLSGDVVTKLAQAKAAAGRDPKYNENVEALEKVQPDPISLDKVYQGISAGWIPNELRERFVGQLMNTGGPPKLMYNENHGMYLWDPSSEQQIDYLKYSGLSTTQWGRESMPFPELFMRVLNNQQIIVRKMDPETKKYVVDIEQTNDLQAKAAMIKEKWFEFLHELPDEDKMELERIYNSRMNRIVNRNFNGDHLTMPGHATVVGDTKFEFYPHQKDAIWRMIQNSSALLAHEVGAGKTNAMVGAAMEMKRLGICKKPLIIVPKALVAQWQQAFLELYPSANILVATDKTFSPEKRARFIAQATMNEPDAIIMTHPQFSRIQTKPETKRAFVNEMIGQIDDLITQLEAGEGGGRRTKSMIKTLEKQKLKMKNMIEHQAAKTQRDKNAFFFEDLGIDQMFVDESDAFKNLYTPTRLRNIRGVASTQSDRSTDMAIKIKHIQYKRGGDKGVVFASGTPVSNTLTEFFVTQKYLQPTILKEYGINSFDGWVNTFGEIERRWEISPESTQKFKLVDRLAKVNNAGELMRLYRTTADVVKKSDLDYIKEPKLEGGKPQVHLVSASPLLKQFIQSLVERAEAIRSGHVDRQQDNMLKVTTDGRKAAIDMRLIDPELPDMPDSKVNSAVRNIAEIYKRTAPGNSTQLVFLDQGVEGGSQFNLYQDMKRKLVAAGVKENEIAFIHDATNDEARAALAKKVREGKIRILIGSTGKMGEGLNVQKKLIHLHELDVPWKPRDIIQRHGRMLRPGNDHDKVAITEYITDGSFDAYSWQLQEAKIRALSLAMEKDTTLRTIGDIEGRALTAAEVKALATGDQSILKKAQIENKLHSLQLKSTLWQQDQNRIRIRYASALETMKTNEETMNKLKEIRKSFGDVEEYKEAPIVVDGKSYGPEERKEAAEALQAIATKVRAKNFMAVDVDPPTEVGTFGKLKLSVEPVRVLGGTDINYIMADDEGHKLKVPAYFGDSKITTYHRLKDEIEKLPDRIDEYGGYLVSGKRKADELKSQIQDRFPGQQELEDSLTELNQIDQKLGLGEDHDDGTGGAEGEAIMDDQENEQESPDDNGSGGDEENDEDQEGDDDEDLGKSMNERNEVKNTATALFNWLLNLKGSSSDGEIIGSN